VSKPILKTWTTAGAQRATITRLDRIDAALIEIAGLWGDMDEFLVGRADELRHAVGELRADVIESFAEADS
jgi:hypothetical protein